MVSRNRSGAALVILLFALGLFAPAALAQDGDTDDQAIGTPDPHRWNVGLKPIPRELQPGDLWHGAEVLKVNRVLDYINVRSASPSFPDTASSDPDVVYVERDEYLQFIQFSPNDPKWTSQYGPESVRADLVWDATLGTTDKNVCIVDTGVRYTHEDLTGARWLGGYDFVNEDTNPWDDQGHGTHVAGIAAASTHNAKGIAGVAQVGIKAAKVLNSGGSGYWSDIADGIEWCADNGGHVINLSLGGVSGASVGQAAVKYAWDQGMVVVAAAGNEGPCSNCVLYPAKYVQSIAVSCTTSSNSQCSFTSDGPEVDIAAPGYDIYATCYSSNTHYCYKSGTSMSAPHVAGVAALVWSESPSSTNQEIRDLLEENAKDLGAAGWDQNYGWGLVDAKAAYDGLGALYPQVPVFEAAFDDGTTNGMTLTGLWRVASLCGSAATSPNYLGFHQASSCSYANGLSASSGEARVDVDLTDQLQATLNFKHRWETESNGDGAYDIMRVQVSTNAGASWTTLASWDSRDANQATWKQETLLLNAYVGSNVRLRFHFDSVDSASNAFDGWHIDNLNVTAIDNYPPIARAGTDRTGADDDGSGDEPVTFDGSASSDRNTGGSIVSYEWFLGPTLLGTGATPTLDVPVGTNTIKLKVTDDGGMSDDDTVSVTVAPNTAPIARAGSDQTVPDPDADGLATVALSGSTSTDSDGTIASYVWKEGETTIATGVSPSVDLSVGTHTVALTITDNGGLTATDTLEVTVNPNVVPSAAAGDDRTLSDGDADGLVSVMLDGSGSGDADGSLVTYEWTRDSTVLATGATPMVDLALGTHTLTLTVTDNGGATATDTVTLVIEANHAPIADPGDDFGVRDIGADGWELVGLDGTASSDDDGTLLSYEWREGSALIATGATPNVNLTYGTHEITLTVTDNGGASASTALVVSVLDDVPPIAAFTPQCSGLACDFDATTSTDDGDIVTYSWTFGDGYSAGGPLASASHIYADVGTYTVCLTITDDGGYTDDLCLDVTLDRTYLRIDFDDGTTGPMSLTGLWRVTSLCTTARSEPSYLGYHNTGSCSFYTGSANSGDATFTVDLAGNSAPVLDFWHRWDTYTSSSTNIHRQYVQARQVGTTAWTTLASWNSLNPNQPTWTNHEVDLAAYAGMEIQIRFRFESVFTSSFYNARPGWHVDWIQVGDSGDIVFPPTAPEAKAGPDVTRRDADGDGTESLTLDGSASSDLDGFLATHTWTEGGITLGTQPTLTRGFSVGTHVLTLAVTDNDGLTGTDTVVVTVQPNRAPTADAGPDVTLEDADGTGAELHTLDGSGSMDPDAPLSAYQWVLANATIGSAATLDHAFPVGVHTVALTVTDLAGVTASDDMVVTVVANEPPVADAGPDKARNDDDRDGTEPITLDGRGSFDPVGGITAWRWETNGTTIGNTSLFTHPFAVGLHTVTLTVTDAAGLTSTDTLTVTITNNRPPVARFTFNCSVVACDLDAGTTTDPDGDTLTYTWAFGDGTTGTGKAVWHAFPHAGFFTVCLTVRDWGLADATCKTVHLVATTFFDDFEDGEAFDWGQSGLWHLDSACSDAASGAFYMGYHTGLLCNYQTLERTLGSATMSVDLREATTGRLVFDHRWVTETTSGTTARDELRVQLSQNGGATWFTLKQWDSRDPNQPNWGKVTVNLDNYVGHDTRIRFYFDSFNALFNHFEGWYIDNVEIVSDAPAVNKPPSASFTFSCDDLACDFDASGSTDFPGGVVASYSWTFGDGTTATGKTASHTYTANGTYSVQLTVTDNGGLTDGHTRSVSVSGTPDINNAPVADFTHTTDDLTVHLDASLSTDADGDLLTYNWDLGDGNTANGLDVDHTYAAAGTYDVTLTVNDGELDDTHTRVVSVGLAENQPPTADFVFTTAGLTVELDGARSSDPDGDALAHSWDLGDGTTLTGVAPTHTYAVAGTYEVTLTVEDPEGLTDSTTEAVTVEADVPVTGPPATPPALPHMPDTTADGPIGNVPWIDIESAWFESDSSGLFIGMKLEDLPNPDRISSQVQYRVAFDPDWTPNDPTYGGRVPLGHEVVRFEARMHISPVGTPVGSTARDIELWARTESATAAPAWRLLSTLDGQASPTTDILWWELPRTLLQAPRGSVLTAPIAEAHPLVDGITELHGATADNTGTGTDYTF